MVFFWDWIRNIIAYFGFGRQAKLLLIGLDNAGKSTLMDRLASGRLIQHPPTDQARSKELSLGNITFTAYDLGGHVQARRVWRDYFPAVDGIVFLVDAADSSRFQEASIELDSILHDETISHVPIVVLGNKNDKREAVEEENLSNILGLTIYRTGKVSHNFSLKLYTTIFQRK
ncbi:hypothetical protein CHS0354_041784 [Potamilus streckersoni]|uniref:small monomeric GTPase n=1 Tax=Potamilus streckersoni TaxID=2493646 RepID=A0AAE0W542_9BIVA|nr:hypothetical protein CHS0354_041784 [Potamilus streckersoni]